MEKQYLRAKDIENLMQVKQSKAYEIIRDVNKKLKEQNYMTLRGRVPARAVYDFFGIDVEHKQ